MKTILKIFLTIQFAVALNLSPDAQTLYGPARVALIHDSIRKGRWDQGGSLSQYSFRYMSEFFPTAIIHGAAEPRQLKKTASSALKRMRVKSEGDSVDLENYLRSLHLAGMIVVHRGAIVYENYLSMLPGDQHTLQSVTKVITSTIIASLINDGKIDPKRAVSVYIPELKGSDWENIPVNDILNMRSGMDTRSVDFTTGPFTNPEHKNYRFESSLGILPRVETTPSSVYDFIASMKRDTISGLEASYSNIDTFVLGWLAEKITGSRFTDIVSERIWQPMGASSNAYICLSYKGVSWPHGGMSATLSDLARFGMLYTHSDIRSRKEKLVSFAQLESIFSAKPASKPFGQFKWAYQWDIAENDMLLKTGFGGQALYVFPKKEIVIACFNYVDSDWGMKQVSDKVIQQIVNILAAK